MVTFKPFQKEGLFYAYLEIMTIKTAEIVLIKEEEQHLISGIIKDYENNGWRLVLIKELDGIGDLEHTHIISFARKTDNEFFIYDELEILEA